MLAKKLRHNPGRLRAIVYAVLVHAVVIGLAVIGFRWTVQSPPGDVVQAVAVPEPPTRKPEETNQRAQEEEEARRKAEEADRRRQAEQKKQQQQKEEELAQQRLVAERKKQEAQEKERQKRMQEEARKKEEARRQKLTEQSLQEQLAAEEKARLAAASAARAGTVVDRYRALIQQQVNNNWNRPLNIKGLKCEVHVRLTPSGEVLSANVVRSSGNAIFDRSVENAVYKAAPLPLPGDPALFDNFREIRFVFDPDKET